MDFDEALGMVNDSFRIDAVRTYRGDEIKGAVHSDDGGRDKSYWGADELRRLAVALEIIAQELDVPASAACGR